MDESVKDGTYSFRMLSSVVASSIATSNVSWSISALSFRSNTAMTSASSNAYVINIHLSSSRFAFSCAFELDNVISACCKLLSAAAASLSNPACSRSFSLQWLGNKRMAATEANSHRNAIQLALHRLGTRIGTNRRAKLGIVQFKPAGSVQFGSVQLSPAGQDPHVVFTSPSLLFTSARLMSSLALASACRLRVRISTVNPSF